MFITPEQTHCLLALNHFGKIGPSGVRLLEKNFSHLYLAFQASPESLLQSGLKLKTVYEFINWRRGWDERPVLNELTNNNINLISWHNPLYPDWLKEISSPPPILYYTGQINNSIFNNLAVVGPRNPSSYAHQLINHLLPTVINQGITIVSGLARGVDTLAHSSTLDNQGIAWAVLGSGLLNIYPKTNTSLAQRIVSNGGAIISEFPPHYPPLKNNFPQRNRLISGLSRATLIIEASQSSGSLITAKYALEQGRDVLAIPGNIFSDNSRGTNKLISDGATVVMSSQDILNIYDLFSPKLDQTKNLAPNHRPVFFDKTEEIIYLCLEAATSRSQKLSVDEIAAETKMASSTINSKLSLLEIKGIAQSHGFRYDLK